MVVQFVNFPIIRLLYLHLIQENTMRNLLCSKIPNKISKEPTKKPPKTSKQTNKKLLMSKEDVDLHLKCPFVAFFFLLFLLPQPGENGL